MVYCWGQILTIAQSLHRLIFKQGDGACQGMHLIEVCNKINLIKLTSPIKLDVISVNSIYRFCVVMLMMSDITDRIIHGYISVLGLCGFFRFCFVKDPTQQGIDGKITYTILTYSTLCGLRNSFYI